MAKSRDSSENDLIIINIFNDDSFSFVANYNFPYPRISN